MKHRCLPAELKAQIRSHFSYTWQKTSVWDEREILLELPVFMRDEVVLFCNLSVLDCIPSLRGLPKNACAKLCLRFEHVVAVPGQVGRPRGNGTSPNNVDGMSAPRTGRRTRRRDGQDFSPRPKRTSRRGFESSRPADDPARGGAAATSPS